MKKLLASLIIGIVFASSAMYMAWQHNPQGEFYADGNINWSDWLLVGGSWFLVFFLGTYIIISICQLILALYRAERSKLN